MVDVVGRAMADDTGACAWRPEGHLLPRCGVFTLAETASVERALAAAPLVQMGDRLQADLDWVPSIGHVTMSLVPLLPDDALDCAVDLGWP